MFGFTQAADPSIFHALIPDEYASGKVMRAINRLLNPNIKELAIFWGKFPEELRIVLRPPTETAEIDTETATKIRTRYMSRINEATTSPDKEDVPMEDVAEDVVKCIKDSRAISLVNEIMEENGSSERVQIREKVNLREILEGVGVKSNYGVDPLRHMGRKQSLLEMEIAIIPPLSDIQIAVSVLSNMPKVSILLCLIRKTSPWIDIEEDSVKKIVINSEIQADGSYLEEIESFIQKAIGE